MFRGLRRFTIGATLLMAGLLPPVLVFMDEIVRFVYGASYAGAANGARFVLVASGLLFVIAWSKSLPVSIGRPGLRVLAHGIQAAVFIPLLVVFGLHWGATGACAALTVAAAVFVVIWWILIVRIHRDRHRGVTIPAEEPA